MHEQCLFTVGYEGSDIATFVDALSAAGVKVLADVRALPLSRKKGFSKNALRAHLEREGITYLHFRELGDPKPGREAARAGRYAEFRRVYAKHLVSPGAKGALAALIEVAGQARTCLMCFEREAADCHRTMIADAFGGEWKVSHLSVGAHACNATTVSGRNSRQGASAA